MAKQAGFVNTGAGGALIAFGLFAVSTMLICYSLERRHPGFILGLGACALGSTCGFLQRVAVRAGGMHPDPGGSAPMVARALMPRQLWPRRHVAELACSHAGDRVGQDADHRFVG